MIACLVVIQKEERVCSLKKVRVFRDNYEREDFRKRFVMLDWEIGTDTEDQCDCFFDPSGEPRSDADFLKKALEGV